MYIDYTPEEAKQHDEIIAKYRKKMRETPQAEHPALLIQHFDDLNNFNLQCQKKRFDALNNDPDAILEDAKKQAEMTITKTREDLTNNDPQDIDMLKEYARLGFGTFEDEVFKFNGTVMANFIKEQLVYHIEAFKDDAELSHRLYSLIVTVIGESKYTTEIDISLFEPVFAPIPNGELISQIIRVSQARSFDHLTALDGRDYYVTTTVTKAIDGDICITRTKKGNGKDKDSEIEIEVEDPDEIARKYNKGFTKIFIYVLAKMHAQNYPSVVKIPLKEMIDKKMYSRTDNALSAINDFYDQQDRLPFSAMLYHGEKLIAQEKGHFFNHLSYRSRSGYVELSLDPKLNVQSLARFVTFFPDAAFKLKDNAFTLVHYIFSQARQNKEKIRESGTFKINLDRIRDRLGLPPVEAVTGRHYKQLIIKPITDAVDEINRELSETANLKVEICVPEKSNIHKWLNGYLEITLSGVVANKLIALAEQQERKIAESKERKVLLKAASNKRRKTKRKN